MARYIDADLLISEIDELKKSPWYNNDYDEHKCARQEAVNIVVDLCIKRAPTADVQEVQHGTWEKPTKMFPYWDWKCSVCGCEEYRQQDSNGHYREMKFCPNCGAKMDGKEDEE